MKDGVLIGIDAGTSVIKSIAFTTKGEQIASAAIPNRYQTFADGGAEQDMARTWADTAATLKELSEKVPNLKDRLIAISVTGQGDGMWLIDKAGDVTEGSASNAWIVDAKGKLVTRTLGNELLGGITRAAILDAARQNKLDVVERAFSLDEALHAHEAMVTSTTAFVLPVVAIDGKPVGSGVPGPIYQRLRPLYEARVSAELGALTA